MGVVVSSDQRARFEEMSPGINTPRMSPAWNGMGEKSLYSYILLGLLVLTSINVPFIYIISDISPHL